MESPYGRIVVGHDGTERSDGAVALGVALSASCDARLALAHVVPTEPTWLKTQRAYQREHHARVRTVLEAARAALPAGVTADPWWTPSLSPARGLQELASGAGVG